MIRLGPHLKITAKPAHRERVRALLTGTLDLGLVDRGDVYDIYRLGSGSVGYFFLDDALSEEEARKGAWIELLVDDPDAVTAALAGQGLTPFDYVDKSHRYFSLPGGQVFRLAGTSAAR